MISNVTSPKNINANFQSIIHKIKEKEDTSSTESNVDSKSVKTAHHIPLTRSLDLELEAEVFTANAWFNQLDPTTVSLTLEKLVETNFNQKEALKHYTRLINKVSNKLIELQHNILTLIIPQGTEHLSITIQRILEHDNTQNIVEKFHYFLQKKFQSMNQKIHFSEEKAQEISTQFAAKLTSQQLARSKFAVKKSVADNDFDSLCVEYLTNLEYLKTIKNTHQDIQDEIINTTKKIFIIEQFSLSNSIKTELIQYTNKLAELEKTEIEYRLNYQKELTAKQLEFAQQKEGIKKTLELIRETNYNTNIQLEKNTQELECLRTKKYNIQQKIPASTKQAVFANLFAMQKTQPINDPHKINPELAKEYKSAIVLYSAQINNLENQCSVLKKQIMPENDDTVYQNLNRLSDELKLLQENFNKQEAVIKEDIAKINTSKAKAQEFLDKQELHCKQKFKTILQQPQESWTNINLVNFEVNYHSIFNEMTTQNNHNIQKTLISFHQDLATIMPLEQELQRLHVQYFKNIEDYNNYERLKLKGISIENTCYKDNHIIFEQWSKKYKVIALLYQNSQSKLEEHLLFTRYNEFLSQPLNTEIDLIYTTEETELISQYYAMKYRLVAHDFMCYLLDNSRYKININASYNFICAQNQLDEDHATKYIKQNNKKSISETITMYETMIDQVQTNLTRLKQKHSADPLLRTSLISAQLKELLNK